MAREPETCVFWELNTCNVEQKGKRKVVDLGHMADMGVWVGVKNTDCCRELGGGGWKKACAFGLAT